VVLGRTGGRRRNHTGQNERDQQFHIWDKLPNALKRPPRKLYSAVPSDS
jgi:hypothetical protein